MLPDLTNPNFKTLINNLQKMYSLTEVGVIGSAAYGHPNFDPDASDIDLIAFHQNNKKGFIFDKYDDGSRYIDVEVHVYGQTHLDQLNQNPEYFGLSWYREIGKIVRAEAFTGSPFTKFGAAFSATITARSTALLCAVGQWKTGQNKLTCKRSTRTDFNDEFNAIVAIINDVYPCESRGFKIYSDDDVEEILKNHQCKSLFETEIFGGKPLEDFVFFPEHKAGLEALAALWGNTPPVIVKSKGL